MEKNFKVLVEDADIVRLCIPVINHSVEVDNFSLASMLFPNEDLGAKIS